MTGDTIALEVAHGEPVVLLASGEAIEVDDEYMEWQTRSADVAREFAKTMLAVSSASLPVLAATGQFLRIDRGPEGWTLCMAGALVLVFLSSVGFAVAIAPSLRAVDPSSFAAYRNRRLREMAARLRAAVVLFLVGLFLAALGFSGTLLYGG